MFIGRYRWRPKYTVVQEIPSAHNFCTSPRELTENRTSICQKFLPGLWKRVSLPIQICAALSFSWSLHTCQCLTLLFFHFHGWQTSNTEEPVQQSTPPQPTSLADIAKKLAPPSPIARGKPPGSPQPYHLYKESKSSKQDSVSLVPKRDGDAIVDQDLSTVKRKQFAEKDSGATAERPGVLGLQETLLDGEAASSPTAMSATPTLQERFGSPDSTRDTLLPFPTADQFPKKTQDSPKAKHVSPLSKNEQEFTVEIDKAGGILGIILAGGNDTSLQSVLVRPCIALNARSASDFLKLYGRA